MVLDFNNWFGGKEVLDREVMNYAGFFRLEPVTRQADLIREMASKRGTELF